MRFTATFPLPANGLRKLKFALVGLCFLVVSASCSPRCYAGLLGGLGTVRNFALENKFEVDFFIAADDSGINTVGLDLEVVVFDIFNSTVNSNPLGGVAPLFGHPTPYSRVSFLPTPSFATWYDGSVEQQFGDTTGGNPSRAGYSAFISGISGYTMTDKDPFHFGTFTFDYSNLGLGKDDSITLDISGVPDPFDSTLLTTGASVFPVAGNAKNIDFEFGTGIGPSSQTLVLGSGGGGGGGGPVVPEPGSGVICLGLAFLSLTRFRRRSARQ